MKTAEELLSEDHSSTCKLRITVSPSGETTDGHVTIRGTPEAFQLLACVLQAQAENQGNTIGCQTVISRRADGSTLFLPDTTHDLVLHCHQEYSEDV
jgi:hypothetical protein